VKGTELASQPPYDNEVSVSELAEHLEGQISRLVLLRRIIVVCAVAGAIGLVAHVIYYYNYLTGLYYDALTEKAKVENTVQYRVNLVPQLVEVLSNFVDHEEYVFDQTVGGRERSVTGGAGSAAPGGAGSAVAAQLRQAAGLPPDEALKKILAIAEQYPNLKAADPFQTVLTKLSESEIAVMELRKTCNDIINVYTTVLAQFPANIYGPLFGFKSMDYIEGTRASEWPQVSVRTNRVGVTRPAAQSQAASAPTPSEVNPPSESAKTPPDAPVSKSGNEQ
jgi:LemA protein